MQNLKMLIQEKEQLDSDLKNPKNNFRAQSFIRIRLNAIEQRIRHFGQRYNCVQVTVKYNEEFLQRERKIYYTDINESDAIDYTRKLIEVNFKVIEITAISIPVGRLI